MDIELDPREQAVWDALVEGAWREGYRSAEELGDHRPDLAKRFTLEALSRFVSRPEGEVVDGEEEK